MHFCSDRIRNISDDVLDHWNKRTQFVGIFKSPHNCWSVRGQRQELWASLQKRYTSNANNSKCAWPRDIDGEWYHKNWSASQGRRRPNASVSGALLLLSLNAQQCISIQVLTRVMILKISTVVFSPLALTRRYSLPTGYYVL